MIKVRQVLLKGIAVSRIKKIAVERNIINQIRCLKQLLVKYNVWFHINHKGKLMMNYPIG